MLRALLASTLLLFACGGNPPVENPADPEAAQLNGISDPVPFTGESDGVGGQNDPCAAAQCNDHHDRDEYTDPADQRLRLRAQDTSSNSGHQ
jgi:hypothetical protein